MKKYHIRKLKLTINPFHAIGLFLYPLETLKNLWFPDVFRGYKKRPMVWNGLNFNNITSLISWNVLTTLHLSKHKVISILSSLNFKFPLTNSSKKDTTGTCTSEHYIGGRRLVFAYFSHDCKWKILVWLTPGLEQLRGLAVKKHFQTQKSDI